MGQYDHLAVYKTNHDLFMSTLACNNEKPTNTNKLAIPMRDKWVKKQIRATKLDNEK